MYRRYRRKAPSLSTTQIIAGLIGALLVLALAKVFRGEPESLSISALIVPLSIITILSIVLTTLVLWYKSKQEKDKLKALVIADIDAMTGVEFEKYVGEILKTKKYTVSFTKTSGDLGVDIVATKNSTKIAVQLKRYTNTVGRAAISDAVAGMAYYKCTSAMVITSNYFTKSAQELAKANKCELVDRDLLSEWIVEFQKQK